MNFNRHDIETYQALDSRAVIGHVSLMIANENSNYILMYADVGSRISADIVKKEHPEKCIQCGIAEQNMIGVGAALSNEGFKVCAVTYAPFISARVLDQVRVTMSIMNSPLILVGISAGTAMSDLGPALTALEDIAQFRVLPNITVISPADNFETIKAMLALVNYDRPVYLRITSGFEQQNVYTNDYIFQIGKAVVLKNGGDTAIISTGTVTYQCLKASEILGTLGISCAVINMHTIKPLDTKTIDELEYKYIFTVEEHSIIGGLGSAVAEHFANRDNAPKVIRVGTQDRYYDADVHGKALEIAELTADAIAMRIVNVLGE